MARLSCRSQRNGYKFIQMDAEAGRQIRRKESWSMKKRQRVYKKTTEISETTFTVSSFKAIKRRKVGRLTGAVKKLGHLWVSLGFGTQKE